MLGLRSESSDAPKLVSLKRVNLRDSFEGRGKGSYLSLLNNTERSYCAMFA